MRYIDSIKFVMAREGWFMNLVMVGICLMIPAVGPIVVMGYTFEIFDYLRQNPAGKEYPLFIWNRFSPYLMRGIFLFVIQLIIQMVVTVPLTFLSFGVAFVSALAAKDAPWLAAVCWMPIVFLSFILGILIAVIQWPMNMYMGVRQKLELGPMWSWAKTFAKRMWKETALSILFLMVTALVLSPLGYAACCVGIVVVAALVMIAQHHLQFQLYAIFLERGGARIPEKDEASGEAMAAVEPAE